MFTFIFPLKANKSIWFVFEQSSNQNKFNLITVNDFLKCYNYLWSLFSYVYSSWSSSNINAAINSLDLVNERAEREHPLQGITAKQHWSNYSFKMLIWNTFQWWNINFEIRSISRMITFVKVNFYFVIKVNSNKN